MEVIEHIKDFLINFLSQSGHSSSSASTTSSSSSSNVKLPKLKLKPFSGNPLYFQEFLDSFNSAIHENESIDRITKFNYLKNLLTGEASSAISGLSLTADNYDEAMDILHERFGNKQVLISTHIDKLLTLPVVNSSNNYKQLRELFDPIEVNIRSLRVLKIHTEENGPILISIIMNKLPNDIKLEISRQMASEREKWEIDDLLRILKREVESRELCFHMSKTSIETSKNKPSSSSAPSTAFALHTSADNQTERLSCLYCKHEHSSSKCDVVTDPKTRKNILRNKARCFICLKSGHRAKFCRSDYKCYKCNQKHHVSICENQVVRNNENTIPVTRVASNVSINKRSSTFLQTARAKATDIQQRHCQNVRVLFDNCSQRSFVTSRLRDRLKLPTLRKERISIRGFGLSGERVEELDVVELNVWNERSACCRRVEVIVTPMICKPICEQNFDLAKASYEHLIDLKLADYNDGESELKVDVLIGADFYWAFATNRIVKGRSGPVAVYTSLGWVLNGTMEGGGCVSSSTNLLIAHVMKVGVESIEGVESTLEDSVQKFWSLEAVGVTLDDEEGDVLKKFENSISFVGNNYTVRLPWKNDVELLPDNYNLSKGRLQSLHKRLKKSPRLLHDYDDVIKEQVKNNIVERLNADDEGIRAGNVHYIPHREVIKENRETTKLRIVYDASAKTPTTPSLNECLETGPCFLPKLFDILIRFRCYKCALTSDIKSAFLNIKVDERDRDFLRFLWFDDIHKDNPSIVVYRFMTIIFGMNSSPFLLGATIYHHMEKYINIHKDIIEKFLKDLYMDDSVSGAQALDDAYSLYLTSKSLMLEGGFLLRKWSSNSEILNNKILKSEVETFGEEINESEESKSILGVQWDVKTDELIFSGENVIKESLKNNSLITKRFVLKTIAGIFYPLGVLSPMVTKLKSFFQELCRLKLTWDEELSSDLKKQRERLLTKTLTLEPIKLKRNYLNLIDLTEIKNIEIHGFADASKMAYAAVVYIRIILNNGNIINNFVASKSRLAPMKGLTIPRLELLGCLILSRLIKSVVSSITDYTVSDIYCWSDSMDCIFWINSVNKVWDRFVQNRVKEIRGNLSNTKWQHCPGNLNPADIPSRGTSLLESENRNIWVGGPQFLYEPPERWPKTSNNEIKNNVGVAKEEISMVNMVNEDSKQLCKIDDVIDKYSFLSFKKLVRVTCYVLRFIENLKRKRLKKDLILTKLSNEELEKSRTLWVINEQKLFSEKQINSLSISMNMYKDNEGVLKLKGRLEYSDLPECAKCPIAIPKESFINELIIFDAHETVLHQGVKDTLNEVRSKYWIISGRRNVKKLIRKCYLCQKHCAKVFQKLPDGPLPDFRCTYSNAFTNTGIDYLGPLYVYPSPNRIKSKMQKVHVALYTCASTRAVHLDVVSDSSSCALVRSMKRFVSRRGYPKFMISDNAKCFVGPELKAYLNKNDIEWSFIPEKTPWWGGFWERMVQTVKKPLRKVLGKASITYDELLTIVTEIEGVINCRPLCYQYSDEVYDVITPSHLMFGRRLLSRDNCKNEIDECTVEHFNKRLKYVNKIISSFEQRWRHEYLTGLRERHVNNNKEPAKQIMENDVVLICDDNLPRYKWKLGRVVELKKSKDDYIRWCKLKVCSSKGNITVINRPINKLCYFEVSGIRENDNVNSNDSSQKIPEQSRPRRVAFLNAGLKRKLTE